MGRPTCMAFHFPFLILFSPIIIFIFHLFFFLSLFCLLYIYIYVIFNSLSNLHLHVPSRITIFLFRSISGHVLHIRLGASTMCSKNTEHC
jgi:hypothetical protein